MITLNHSDITKFIEQDLSKVSQKSTKGFQLIRAKDGVYVYRCLYDTVPAVVKYYEKEDDRREILNYQILAKHDISTIKALAFGKATLVMEDISASKDWRLGEAKDFEDTNVAKGLAQWYFTLHENGSVAEELEDLYFEFDSITKENIKMLIDKLSEAKELLELVLTHFGRFKELIHQPSFTLTYNDFHWSNFVVRKDKKAAMMFDYNLLGKGYRFSDFSNVCYAISNDAKAAFVRKYNRMYFEKHGCTRKEDEKAEKNIDDLAAPLFALITAFTKRESFPSWAEGVKNEALNGSLLAKAKMLLV